MACVELTFHLFGPHVAVAYTPLSTEFWIEGRGPKEGEDGWRFWTYYRDGSRYPGAEPDLLLGAFEHAREAKEACDRVWAAVQTGVDPFREEVDAWR